MAGKRHSGRCLCGDVAFEATGAPKWITYCHCESCRRHTASPVAVFVGFEESALTFTKAAPRRYESSAGVTRGFCGRCGSPVSYQSVRYPGEIHIYGGVMDEPEGYRPEAHVYFGEHLAWFDTTDALQRFERSSQDD